MKRWKKILLTSVIVLITASGWVVYFASDKISRIDPRTPEISSQIIEPPQVSDFNKAELLTRTNENRANAGLPSLSENLLLDKSATTKCERMAELDFWSHNDPDGTSQWRYITQAKYSYSAAGENLAYGYTDSRGVIEGWMFSPTHKENLLKTDFTEVGFGICGAKSYTGNKNSNRSGEPTVIVVQHLARPYGQ